MSIERSDCCNVTMVKGAWTIRTKKFLWITWEVSKPFRKCPKCQKPCNVKKTIIIPLHPE